MLPFCIRSYYHFRHRQRQGEIVRIFEKLKDLDDTTIEELSKETRLRLSSLTRATRAVETDNNIKRLQKAAQLLSEYWESESEIEPLPDKPRVSMA